MNWAGKAALSSKYPCKHNQKALAKIISISKSIVFQFFKYCSHCWENKADCKNKVISHLINL